MSIEVRNLNKRFGATVVCDNLNLDIPDGELVALLGPSGSSKTSEPSTLSRSIRSVVYSEGQRSGWISASGDGRRRVPINGRSRVRRR